MKLNKYIVSLSVLAILGAVFAFNANKAEAACLPTDAPSITITSPNGGEIYNAGQKVTLKWTSCNVAPTEKLYLGLTWSTDKYGEAGGVVNSDTPILNDGNETYTLPASVGGPGDYYQSGVYYKFMVYKALSNGKVGVQYDISDNPFTIQATPIKLTSPMSGQLTPGQTVNITWTGGEASAPIRISLIKVSPFQVYTVITDTAPNTGSYTWTIPTNVPNNTYQFYVQSNRGKPGSTWSYGGNITISKTAMTGDTVTVNYTGRLQNGTVFDSTIDPNFNHVQPLVFTIGSGQMITGFNNGIIGMKVGEKKTLTIAPGDAYGIDGIPGVIPPNATLIFDVELLAITK